MHVVAVFELFTVLGQQSRRVWPQCDEIWKQYVGDACAVVVGLGCVCVLIAIMCSLFATRRRGRIKDNVKDQCADSGELPAVFDGVFGWRWCWRVGRASQYCVGNFFKNHSSGRRKVAGKTTIKSSFAADVTH